MNILEKSKKALTYLGAVHLEAVAITYLWTGEMFGSIGAVATIFAVSLPTYILVDKVWEE